MKGQELISLLRTTLRENDCSIQQFAQDDLDQETYDQLTAALGEFENVSHRRNNAIMVVVVHFKQHNIYLEFDGDYDSWSGTNFHDCEPFEVVKATKVVEYWKQV